MARYEAKLTIKLDIGSRCLEVAVFESGGDESLRLSGFRFTSSDRSGSCQTMFEFQLRKRKAKWVAEPLKKKFQQAVVASFPENIQARLESGQVHVSNESHLEILYYKQCFGTLSSRNEGNFYIQQLLLF